MKKTLLLCLVLVLCWGGVVFAAVTENTTIKLTYKPVITEIKYFGVSDNKLTFETGTEPSGNVLEVTKNLKTNNSYDMNISWHYVNATDAKLKCKVELTSTNAGVLKNGESAIPYTITLNSYEPSDLFKTTISDVAAYANHKLEAPVSFTFENTQISGAKYNREFWGGVTLTVTKGADIALSEILDGDYLDTITIKLTTL